MTQSQNTKIKAFVCVGISGGDWQVGEKIPSEYQLSRQFGVSRMTVNRALRELEMEGRITRVQGVGSFVARIVPQAPLFEIQSLRAAIESRGEIYSCQIIALLETQASERTARRMVIPVGGRVFYLEALHLSDGVPAQLERRFVRPSVAPDFLNQTFLTETASDYLLRVLPFTSVKHTVEHTVSAIVADADLRDKLALPADAACLQLTRRTQIGEKVITDVDLIHPGESFRLYGAFSPLSKSQMVAS